MMSNVTNKQDQNAIQFTIEQLVRYGYNKNMLDVADIPFVRNQLLQLFKIAAPSEEKLDNNDELDIDHIMNKLLDYGVKIGLVEGNTLTYRDLLDAKIMGLLMARPSQFIAHFNELSQTKGLQAATQYFYDLSINSRYIRMDRVKLNPSWYYEADYGKLQITINLSKPEKDPVEIAKLKAMKHSTHAYPKCLLCKENLGYEGRLDHPARQNLRLLPMILQGEQWYMQYSPYVYYNEHSIVLKGEHDEMKITNASFARLLDFVSEFPHYFIGSNADLPIVGGSILNHDHYQAGRHQFPMETAPIIKKYKSDKYPEVTLSLVDWPLSVVRLQSKSKDKLLEVAAVVLAEWKGYSDEEHHILAHTVLETGEQIPHNTITPIARVVANDTYELDLVLRNNRTTTQYPFGIFHPHEHLHHIKKENIGLIEVMGLAVLPARLKVELQQISHIMASGNENLLAETKLKEHPLVAHNEWITYLFNSYGWFENEVEALSVLQKEVGKRFAEVLEAAGVFKRNSVGIDGFDKFIRKINFN